MVEVDPVEDVLDVGAGLSEAVAEVVDVDLEGGSSGTRPLRLGLLKDGLGCCGRLAATAAVAAADWAGWAAAVAG